MPIDYPALASEITTDPRGYGYTTDTAVGNDQGVADRLNRVRDGSTGTVPTNPTAAGGAADGKVLVKRANVTGGEIFHALSVADLVNNPGASQLEWFNALLHAPFPIRLLYEDGTATPVRTNIIGLVRSGTPSLARLAELETRPGSRGEELFGAGVRVSSSDVAKALRG